KLFSTLFSLKKTWLLSLQRAKCQLNSDSNLQRFSSFWNPLKLSFI
ncbi:unnamed protein product, partial [Amoebophrya sp. A25]